MASLEVAIVIGGLLASFTVCAVKIIHQIQNSKCRFIRCCGNVETSACVIQPLTCQKQKFKYLSHQVHSKCNPLDGSLRHHR